LFCSYQLIDALGVIGADAIATLVVTTNDLKNSLGEFFLLDSKRIKELTAREEIKASVAVEQVDETLMELKAAAF
jgi:hypothetical protein